MKKLFLVCFIYAGVLLTGAVLNQLFEHRSFGPPPTVSGTLVFARGQDIWTMESNASSPMQLTHEIGDNFADNPRFSPNGGSIAYVHHQAASGAELRVVRADGSDDRTVVASQTPAESIDAPAWAPNGQSIFFGHQIRIFNQAGQYAGDQLSVDEIDLANGNVRSVVENAILPDTSASGKLSWVAFNPSDATFTLWVATNNQTRTALASAVLSGDDFQAIYSPRLSPDGQFIAFSAWGRTTSDVQATGLSLAALLDPLRPEVAQAHGLAWDVWRIGVDGSGLQKVVGVGTDEQSLAWMPDGQVIALARIGGLYVARPDGSGLQQILGQGMAAGLDWKSP